jgi:hypothetical protein
MTELNEFSSRTSSRVPELIQFAEVARELTTPTIAQTHMVIGFAGSRIPSLTRPVNRLTSEFAGLSGILWCRKPRARPEERIAFPCGVRSKRQLAASNQKPFPRCEAEVIGIGVDGLPLWWVQVGSFTNMRPLAGGLEANYLVFNAASERKTLPRCGWWILKGAGNL